MNETINYLFQNYYLEKFTEKHLQACIDGQMISTSDGVILFILIILISIFAVVFLVKFAYLNNFILEQKLQKKYQEYRNERKGLL